MKNEMRNLSFLIELRCFPVSVSLCLCLSVCLCLCLSLFLRWPCTSLSPYSFSCLSKNMRKKKGLWSVNYGDQNKCQTSYRISTVEHLAFNISVLLGFLTGKHRLFSSRCGVWCVAGIPGLYGWVHCGWLLQYYPLQSQLPSRQHRRRYEPRTALQG